MWLLMQRGSSMHFLLRDYFFIDTFSFEISILVQHSNWFDSFLQERVLSATMFSFMLSFEMPLLLLSRRLRFYLISFMVLCRSRSIASSPRPLLLVLNHSPHQVPRSCFIFVEVTLLLPLRKSIPKLTAGLFSSTLEGLPSSRNTFTSRFFPFLIADTIKLY